MPETLRSTHREIQSLLDEKVRYPIDLFGGDSWQMYLPDPTVALAAVTRFRAALFADHGIHTRMVIAIDRIDFLNTENLSGYSNNATQSNQIQAGPADSGLLVRRNAAPPRQFQFGVRYVF